MFYSEGGIFIRGVLIVKVMNSALIPLPPKSQPSLPQGSPQSSYQLLLFGGGVLLWKCRIQHFHYLHISAFYGETFHSLSLCAFQHSQYARPQGSSSSQRSSASIIKCNLLHQGQLFKYSFISFYIYIALYTTFTITGVTNKLKPVMDNRKGLRENRAVKDRSRVIGGQLNGGKRGS